MSNIGFNYNLSFRGYDTIKPQRAPIQPLTPQEKSELASSIERLTAKVGLENGSIKPQRAPIQALTAEERNLLEESIKRLKSMIKK